MIITPTDLENRFGADIVKQWADDDRDGTADVAVVNAAISQAIGYVEDKLAAAYPSVIPFTVGNTPITIQVICCDIAGYWLAGRRQKAADHYQQRFDQANARLTALCEPDTSLTLPDGTVVFSAGSSEANTSGQSWSNTLETDLTFTDTKMNQFVRNY